MRKQQERSSTLERALAGFEPKPRELDWQQYLLKSKVQVGIEKLATEGETEEKGEADLIQDIRAWLRVPTLRLLNLVTSEPAYLLYRILPFVLQD